MHLGILPLLPCGPISSTNILLLHSFQDIVQAHGAIQFSGSKMRMLEDTEDRTSLFVSNSSQCDTVWVKDRQVNIKYVDE
jgi:hypothetical protein